VTDGVEPALTPKEWEDFALDPRFWLEHDGEARDCAQEIAINNAALPDTDRRKITRERLAVLRDPAYRESELSEFVDALESYLPPLP
jgi:hypothetical protein